MSYPSDSSFTTLAPQVTSADSWPPSSFSSANVPSSTTASYYPSVQPSATSVFTTVGSKKTPSIDPSFITVASALFSLILGLVSLILYRTRRRAGMFFLDEHDDMEMTSALTDDVSGLYAISSRSV